MHRRGGSTISSKEFNLEIEGVIGTIMSFTKDPFIIGYTNGLRKAFQENDKELVLIVLKKLLHWYNINIEAIQNDRYVHNKDAHKKSLDILNNYLQESLHLEQ